MSLYLPLCECSCHTSITNLRPLVGFDPTIDLDVVEAAVACSKCQPSHARIFERPRFPYKLTTLLPYSTDGDPKDSSEGTES